MALIAMAVHDTEENGRSAYTLATLSNLLESVDFRQHRLFVSDNNSCEETRISVYGYLKDTWEVCKLPKDNLHIIYNTENIGTAEAINLCWQNRRIGENAIKMDNDVVVSKRVLGWVEEMEAAIARYSSLGLVGLKRKDLEQAPWSEQYRSELKMLPHDKGQPWIVVETCEDIMGTCVMHSAALLDKVGYLYQPGLYGFDDVLMSIRSRVAGFTNCFLPHIEIEHIDKGGDDYCKWKEKHSGEQWQEINNIVNGYKGGTRAVFYSPFGPAPKPPKGT